MAGRIPQHFIDELLNRVDIVDVIDSRVPLRKAGRDFQARCPFHDEKTPSFTVSQSKQFYHCFGCGAHGTVISFLMEYEHLEFVEAIKELAQRSGMQIPALEEGRNRGQDPDLYGLLKETAVFYQRQLRSHPNKATAIAYLSDRGLTGQIAAEFGIGYSPPGWDNLIKALGHTPQRQKELVTTGMAIRKDTGGCYDRFRDRIMFPIRDRRGRVIAFGGRVLGQETPKYLNSPESPLFHKGRELYGLYEARQALRHIDRLLVVEGYMDVVALAQHNIRYAVATLGTALTVEHLNPLFRSATEVVFCFDGDRAGREAAWKALDVVLPEIQEGRTARFMFLPEGEDPDSMVRKIGHDAFEKQIKNAVPLSQFLIDNLLQQVDMTAIDGRARLVDLARPKLAKINNPIFRQLLIGNLADYINMPSQELLRLLGETPVTEEPSRPTRKTKNGPRKLSPLRTAITLLLNYPQLAHESADPRRYLHLKEPGVRLLVELLEFIRNKPHISCGAILEHWRNQPEGRHLGKLAQIPLNTPEEGVTAEFQGALRLLDRQLVEHEYSRLLRKSESEPLSQDEKRRLTELQTEKRELARK